jgi:hypothetical protein
MKCSGLSNTSGPENWAIIPSNSWWLAGRVHHRQAFTELQSNHLQVGQSLGVFIITGATTGRQKQTWKFIDWLIYDWAEDK